ncbi:hypothetical protein HMPREF9413_5331 [Paenibacillus sp. HGF7]|nr:hypothetical protein HMPREF9413_5331 [Paenibacillus sp. HGF7]
MYVGSYFCAMLADIIRRKTSPIKRLTRPADVAFFISE